MDLYDEVRRASTDAQVVEAIRQWVNIELASLNNISRSEQTARLIASTICGDMHWLAELIAAAKSDPDIWEGLRRYALEQAQEGQPIEPDLVVLLSNGEPKKQRGRPKGSSSYIEGRNMVYARAVWCVYHGSAGRYTRATNDTHTKNAFLLVSSATGATFEMVRNACKGQLTRLTQIYRHAEKNNINWHPGHSGNANKNRG
ncbi:hypothetical protein [Pseudomonas cyclaminis]|uniref:hypothetical protein n=1 Tax=Pseudomonas cyclaminis TaxID=2781239 RepID=UPI003825498F